MNFILISLCGRACSSTTECGSGSSLPSRPAGISSAPRSRIGVSYSNVSMPSTMTRVLRLWANIAIECIIASLSGRIPSSFIKERSILLKSIAGQFQKIAKTRIAASEAIDCEIDARSAQPLRGRHSRSLAKVHGQVHRLGVGRTLDAELRSLRSQQFHVFFSSSSETSAASRDTNAESIFHNCVDLTIGLPKP